jgi:ABC-type uncharacterized transport system permease subunit
MYSYIDFFFQSNSVYMLFCSFLFVLYAAAPLKQKNSLVMCKLQTPVFTVTPYILNIFVLT